MFHIHLLDLEFHGVSGVIASYLIETEEELVLIETGPESTFPILRREVEKRGFSLKAIDKVFLTHIHLDHGGAAWRMAELGAQIFVHPNGAPHLTNPEKLYASAKRIYQDQMESLWGKLNSIPENQVISIQDGEKVRVGKHYHIIAIDTQGHAKHHHSYLFEGYLFTGDSAGVRIGTGPILPATPPPDIHLPTWHQRIKRIKALPIRYICLSHFGMFGDPNYHFEKLQEVLEEWSSLIKKLLQQYPPEEVISQFEKEIEKRLKKYGLSEKLISKYRLADPFWMNAQGLIRYWKKYGEA